MATTVISKSSIKVVSAGDTSVAAAGSLVVTGGNYWIISFIGGTGTVNVDIKNTADTFVVKNYAANTLFEGGGLPLASGTIIRNNGAGPITVSYTVFITS